MDHPELEAQLARQRRYALQKIKDDPALRRRILERVNDSRPINLKLFIELTAEVGRRRETGEHLKGCPAVSNGGKCTCPASMRTHIIRVFDEAQLGGGDERADEGRKDGTTD